jgi:hypothetical protein
VIRQFQALAEREESDSRRRDRHDSERAASVLQNEGPVGAVPANTAMTEPNDDDRGPKSFCASCGAEIALWFDPSRMIYVVNDEDEAY